MDRSAGSLRVEGLSDSFSADGIVGPGWQPWEAAAGVALIRAVGGSVATLGGLPLDFRSYVANPFVAGSSRAEARLTTPGRIASLPDRGHLG